MSVPTTAMAATASVSGRVQGLMMGWPEMSPWSLAAATIEPEKVIEPMTAPRTTKIEVEMLYSGVLTTWKKSSIATSAAAPPPTALNSDTSWGIAVIFTARARYRPMPPPMTKPTMMIAQASMRQATRSERQPDERGDDRDGHAQRRQLVAVARRGRAVHLVETDDEQRGADEPGEEDERVERAPGHRSGPLGRRRRRPWEPRASS